MEYKDPRVWTLRDHTTWLDHYLVREKDFIYKWKWEVVKVSDEYGN